MHNNKVKLAGTKIDKMKIRMVIPECQNWNGWYCSKSVCIDLRIEILKK